MKSSGSCNQVDQFCLAPPALADSGSVSDCFACSLPVCENCSIVVDYLDYGEQRICHACVYEHLDHFDERPMEHLRLIAGGGALPLSSWSPSPIPWSRRRGNRRR
jgi:hypothetical protein